MVAIEQGSDGDHVDGNAEKTSECFFEVDQVEQRTVGLELDEEVDVAVVVSLAASDGSKDRNAAAVVLANESKDLVASLSDQ